MKKIIFWAISIAIFLVLAFRLYFDLKVIVVTEIISGYVFAISLSCTLIFIFENKKNSILKKSIQLTSSYLIIILAVFVIRKLN